MEVPHSLRQYTFCQSLFVGNSVLRKALPSRSLYALTRKEITRGIANRFVHSRTYIILYLTMAALSITTVALSLGSGCPPKAFYVLEFIINSAMILEVSIRLVAFGKVCLLFRPFSLTFTMTLFPSNFGSPRSTLLISSSPFSVQLQFWP